MFKKTFIITVGLLLIILMVAGCQNTAQPTSTSTASSIIKSVELAARWQMNQMNLVIKAKDELLLLLKLAPEEKADGYFYLEKGKNLNFDITGNTLIYASQPQDASTKITSARFSFTASQAQGTTYTLAFRNNTDSQVTAFLELIFPVTGSIYVPVPKE